MKNKNKIRFTIIAICCLILILIISFSYNKMSLENKDKVVANIAAVTNNDFIYLSDIDYIPALSVSGWKSLYKDRDGNGDKIAVRVENALYSFDKGMWAHASSTLVYDISELDYNYFTSYVGLNKTASSSSNGVKFYIYTSMDGNNWTLKTEEDGILKKPGENASYVKVDIKGAKFLKLYADAFGNNGNDHSVYADAKLTKNDYDDNVVPTLEEFNAKLKSYEKPEFDNPEYELLLLQRNFIQNAGNFALRRFVNESSENREAFNWLYYNLENLRLYTEAGTPDGGSYYNSLTVLKNLLVNYKDDFDIKEKTKYGTVLGDLYKKMAIALSHTHATTVYLWMNGAGRPETVSNPVKRYQIYKDLHKNGNMRYTNTIDFAEWFEKYEIEEMRYVLNNIIDDESILWLNEYTQSFIDAHPNNPNWYLSPHPYMKYLWPNYGRPEYYDAANYEKWDEKYKGVFSKYGIPYGLPNVARLWMNMEGGAVCGGISKLGSNNRGVHGVPSTVVSQPGHAAFAYYTQNKDGDGAWTLNNFITGWEQSGKTERLSVRMPLGWGNDSYVSGWAASYILMAQEAMNHFDKYALSEKYIMVADIYMDNATIREEYLRKSLEALNYNVDAWWALINLYKNDATKTEQDYYKLADELSEALMPFPLPMKNLLDQISNKFTSPEYIFSYNLLLNKRLTEGSVLNDNTKVFTPSYTRSIAAFLLGNTNTALATFSFDGENANKIILGSHLSDKDVYWDYSLDNKKTWTTVYSEAGTEHSVKLSSDEIESISEENDIYVHIIGVSPVYNDRNTYKIDITKNANPSGLFASDLENRIIGVNDTYEWRYSINDDWASYKTLSPNLLGDKTIEVRIGASGTKLPSNTIKYTFTTDKDTLNRKYIPVSHLSIASVSSEATSNGGNAIYAIDGNYNTRWHSAWNGTDTNKFIVIKLDKEIPLSAIEYVPADGGNGRILEVQVLGSKDGENFTEIGRTTWDNNSAIKSIDFKDTPMVQYVKIIGLRTTSAGGGSFIGAKAFNFYQDLSKNPHPTAGIEYSTMSPTNGTVEARIVSPSTDITITNNNNSTSYIFDKNGSFTFEFVDSKGLTGSATATVSWIDKEKPTSEVKYNPSSNTNKDVTATLKNISEDIYLLDKNNNKVNYVEVANKKVIYISYLDNLGNPTKVLYLDDLGNTKSIEYHEKNIIYIVDYDTKGNIIKETFSHLEGMQISEQEKEEIRKLNSLTRSKPLEYTYEENGEYTFKIMDKAGNKSEIKTSVDYIDKTIPKGYIEYDITTKTKKEVTASISFDKENVKITNNNGKNTYTFKENGTFTFEFIDSYGNVGHATATVSWIVKETPEKPVSPDKPITPENPVTPSKPNDNKPSEKPNEQAKPNNKPSNEGNTSTNNYIKFNKDDIEIEINKNLIKEGLILKKNIIIPSSNITNKFSKNSEYFEIHFENKFNKKEDINGEMILTINLNKNKEFLNIYEIDNNKTIKLDYEKEDNKVTIKTNHLGKYVIEYKDDEVKEETKEVVKSNINWSIASILILILGSVLVLIIKKEK